MDFGPIESFFSENGMANKGALCAGLVVSRYARDKGLPLRFEDMKTPGTGQIRLLGVQRVQAILSDYGIKRILAKEGGRTSRGNMGLCEKYTTFLNDHNYTADQLKEIELWWIRRVRNYFAGSPLVLKMDAAKSMRAIVRELLAMAETRQAEERGSTIVGTIIQHLVGAKLSMVLPTAPEMHGANVADDFSSRHGDFEFEDVVIHVTTAPGEPVLTKCASNLDEGKRPILITTYRQVPVAEGLAEQHHIADRIDIFDIEQFIGSNLYELGNFRQEGRKATAERLVRAYNAIVDEHETDPSLKISIGA